MTNSLQNNNNKLDKSNNDKLDKSNNDIEFVKQLEALPKKEKDATIAKLEMHSGPLPHPDILEGYQKLYPDAAKLIINNGIEESRHRRDLETKRQKRRGRIAYIAIVSVVIMCAMFIYLSFLLIMNNHKIIGTVFGGAGFIFILGSITQLVEPLTSNNNDNEES
ncbi:DUF2335 domain-containing protein [Apilactobacillus xinyiensis]|uniref:DUF2335 domain-containing protein n=1 Tax=Apilactobacillus xinyiensis TaxID=2841032 RepID=UPI00200D15DF|nr:DUF2335 domain-containing protein [Apilactobacillus xinyiensis]MCL0330594.1 DUF2335 domain-containing protein [Apilactobacillus xinyiensis]